MKKEEEEETLNIIVQREQNQFDVASIKKFLSSQKNKEIKPVFAYFHNDSCKVPGAPPRPCWISKIFLCLICFLK